MFHNLIALFGKIRLELSAGAVAWAWVEAVHYLPGLSFNFNSAIFRYTFRRMQGVLGEERNLVN